MRVLLNKIKPEIRDGPRTVHDRLLEKLSQTSIIKMHFERNNMEGKLIFIYMLSLWIGCKKKYSSNGDNSEVDIYTFGYFPF